MVIGLYNKFVKRLSLIATKLLKITKMNVRFFIMNLLQIYILIKRSYIIFDYQLSFISFQSTPVGQYGVMVHNLICSLFANVWNCPTQLFQGFRWGQFIGWFPSPLLNNKNALSFSYIEKNWIFNKCPKKF